MVEIYQCQLMVLLFTMSLRKKSLKQSLYFICSFLESLPLEYEIPHSSDSGDFSNYSDYSYELDTTSRIMIN